MSKLYCNKDNKLKLFRLESLRKDNTIVILPADKGNATVVMDSSLYEEKMKEILFDGNTYRKLKRNPTPCIEMTVAEKVKQATSKWIDPRSAQGPTHTQLLQPTTNLWSSKDNNPLQPIISTIGSPTYRLAKELACTISPLAGKGDNFVKNSTHFASDAHTMK